MVQGKPSGKYRYIYTKVDKRPQFIITDKCNLCPFLMDETGFDTKCSKFINPVTNTNFIKKIYSYAHSISSTGKIKMEVLTPIEIPNWCGLPNHASKISYKDNINYIKNGKLHTESGENYAKTVTIISDTRIKRDKTDLESLVSVGEKKYEYKKQDTNICSCCGENKENVDRTKKMGMCEECWKHNKNNNTKMNFAFINNFRLKRKESWKKEDFKYV